MELPVVEIAGLRVAIDDPIIGQFSDEIATERAQYDIRVNMDIRVDLAAAHAGRLASITEAMRSNFNEEGEVESTSPDQVEGRLVNLALQVPSASGNQFLDSYLYMRATRTMAADYGPDSSIGFRILHRLALQKAAIIKEDAFEFEDANDLLNFGFSSRLLEDIVLGLESGEEPYVSELSAQILTQPDMLVAFLDSVYIQAALKWKKESPDEPKDFGDVVHEAPEEPEEEIEISSDLLKGIDIALLKLISQLEYRRSRYVQDPTILAILGMGSIVLRARGMIKDSNYLSVEKLMLHSNRVPGSNKAMCRPEMQEKYRFNSSIFFPGRGESTEEARSKCEHCRIQDDCLDYALAESVKFGIWGGTSEKERRRIRRARNAAAREAAAQLIPESLLDEVDDAVSASV